MISPVQIHLLLNHVPVLGVPFGALLLAFAVLRRNEDLAKAGLWSLVVAGLSAIPVFWSGDESEELVEHLPGVVEAAIHAHDEAAEKALTAALVLGGLALLVLGLAWKRKALDWRGVYAALLLSLPVFGALAYAAHLGGLIRHPELASGRRPAASGAERPGDEDD